MKTKKLSLLPITIISLFLSFASCTKTEEGKVLEKPNIVWIVSEDNGPFLGCYGDEFATTPSIDKLASQGVAFDNAFANAPVCAPARSTLISGIYPPSMGTENMRSVYNIPELVRFFPQYLREEGYYCTNNSKEDYNMPKPDSVWNESGKEAHYKNRKEGQPFFAIFNFTTSHESCLHKSIPNEELRHKPEDVTLPPHHPDTPEMRHDWAQYYDKIEDMDKKVGEVVKELEEAGLAENTIVFYYSDHGGVLARSKRFVYDSGVKVPLVIRFPEKYKHLAPGEAGTRTDRLVSFVDFAPTILSMAGIPVPDQMQGKAFLGEQQTEPRDYVHCFRGRMDERIDLVRAVRDKQFKYIRNFMPHRIYAQYIEYLWRAPSVGSWEKAYKEGNCNEAQSAFWEQKPAEELYDTSKDPWEVNNLADDPVYADVLERMRKECTSWQTEIRDSGLMPEGEMAKRSENIPIYEYVRSADYKFEEVMAMAEKAARKDVAFLPEFIDNLGNEDALVRYWAATGCLALGEKAKPAVNVLKAALEDPNADVRITAAEALCGLGYNKEGVATLVDALGDETEMVRVHALNSLTLIDREEAQKSMPAVKAMLDGKVATDFKRGYDLRAGAYLVELFEGK
ncbi:sulfatase-like hydrolase/transferase [Flammeovirgaceae bacterium SG7u.111]|nr:sulfatase-like hydrolase/transferase [Flammeovirgaceae bacterium SG7u.132]WPO33583.1 sulfatase-like hydrolase/transferase [Flammeovirgaceae bacterium SG7u.111]